MRYGETNPLIGRTVVRAEIAQDRESLTFETTQGPVIARAQGDCCSQTWIENVEGLDALLGRVVTSVEDIKMPDLGNVGTTIHPDVDEVAYYGTRIMADNGAICTIDFRNDSNGYYGGSLEWTVA